MQLGHDARPSETTWLWNTEDTKKVGLIGECDLGSQGCLLWKEPYGSYLWSLLGVARGSDKLGLLRPLLICRISNYKTGGL